MKAYSTKAKRLSGTSFEEVNKKARLVMREIEKRTRRGPYLRSPYFNKDKIFLEYFWPHLNQKPKRERTQRLRFLSCAIDLIERSHFAPSTKENPNSRQELPHRFVGITEENEIFYVQIKEDKKTKHKYFMSVFPAE